MAPRSASNELRDSVQALRSEMRAGFDRLEERFDSMQRTMIIGFAVCHATIVVGWLLMLVLN